MTEGSELLSATTDLHHLRTNVSAVKSLLSSTTLFMAVVKANAYGHGLVPVAKAALGAGADRLGVARLREAIDLRRAGIEAPIHVLSELAPDAGPAAIEHRLIPTVYSLGAARLLDEACRILSQSLRVHVKVDTGMHRVGADPRDIEDLVSFIRASDRLQLEGMMTHFAVADQPDNNFSVEQLSRFLALRGKYEDVPIWHAANSAATLFFPESRLDMVRVGIAMYGLQPSTRMPSPIDLQPVLSLRAKVTLVRDVAAGEGVSYGLTYVAPKPVVVAILPIGYGDGYSRSLSNRADVLIGGRRLRIVGNICMDQLMVEVPHSDMQVMPGQEATLIGRDDDQVITAEELAGILGTINYEITCMINERVPRTYLGDSST